MQKTFRTLLAACTAAVVAAACSTAPTETADAKPDPRQGAEVKNICFQSQIRNWSALDRRAVIVEKGVNDYYKLDLAGTCDPQDAFNSIGLISRPAGGSCLETGDQLVTDSRYPGGTCSITRIFKWNKDADKAASTVTPSAN